MCGIFTYLSNGEISDSLQKQLIKEALRSKHRGPDNTKYRMESKNIFVCFHRLCINDISEKGDQPLTHPDHYNIILLCNGEIYNHKALIAANGFKTQSGSDCEVILHLYTKYGFKKTIEMLDGVFACTLIDLRDDETKIFAARDPIGVRSLYIGKNDNGDIAFCSEMKSLHNLCESIEQFPPGHIWDNESGQYNCFYDLGLKYYNELPKEESLEQVKENIRNLFTTAVTKRFMSDRPIGCLLSGGLDSSLVAALLAKHYDKGALHTYSVGLEGSPDLRYAKMVADHIKSIHHAVIVTEKEMIEALESDIYQIETYDTTTIRASTPMFLLSKYIKENSNQPVIYSGEGSDEASGSYLYFHNAPNEKAFKDETVRLMNDLCYFDVLRCDKSTAGAGLEVRVPFLDKDFLEYYMNIESSLKIPKKDRIEKHLLRSAFDGFNLLPKEVLWRMKEGMSDGVSSQKKGWYEIIQEHIETIYTDEEFEVLKSKYKWNPPMFKEALYFREVFNKHFNGRDKTIPYYWLPKWSGDLVEPSARALVGVYKNEESDSDGERSAVATLSL